MAILDIETYPSKILKQVAEPVEAIDAEVRQLMDDMLETMYSRKGIGLAAPQVDISRRVIVVDVNLQEGDNYPVLTLANPVITDSSDNKDEFEEGCLSVPDLLVVIKRPCQVTVEALDRDGNKVSIEADGLLAIALQHEMDHLDGKLIIDKASILKREFYKKRIKKQAVRAF